MAGQGFRLDVAEIGTIGVKPCEEEGPPGLPGVESLSCVDILQVCVVGPHQERQLGPLDPMALLLQLHHQRFPVPHVIVPLCWVESVREEGTRVELLVGCSMLE